jgi:DHA1 family bicyclomycin/chloramphenicol resistance-like MFS transporter
MYHPTLPGTFMADETISDVTAATRPEVSSTFLQISVLAALAAT